MFAFVWLLLSAYARLVSSTTQNDGYFSPAPPRQSFNVFLLAGQSNMSGRGGVINATWDGVVPPQSQPRASGILRLSANDVWVNAKEPLHKDIDVNNVCGVGPGMAFANSVMNKDSGIGVVGLVPCAVGGTKISEWGRGTALYGRLVRRAEAAAGSGGVIRALLWYQGEADTVNHEDAKMYKWRLERFFTHLRADLQLPQLPIIQVALASGTGPYVGTVRKAQFKVDLPNVKTVDAAGLRLQPDHLHLSTSSQVQLGEMLADTFLQSIPALPAPIQSKELGIIIPANEETPSIIKRSDADGLRGNNVRHIFILAGQSNMAGRGGVRKGIWDGFIPRECEPNPAIHRLSASLTWEEAREPLHADIDLNKTVGIGPGMVFANTVLQKGDRFKVIGLVPCAVGASSINDWCRGSVLYNNLIARAIVAIKDGGIIEAILWYQGERDTFHTKDVDHYKDKLEHLILDLRNDLRLPNLPVIEVLLSSSNGPLLDALREEQRGVDLPNVIKVDPLGLPLQPDGVHLTTVAQVSLGEMMADAFLKFKPNVQKRL
ncbi:OLC1v1016854C2 [Oldenlandia corymbosa var. corymbosa]|uniref:OLC1v1016854C2 n=1 Tax=Oldenlandia corymbosa var. corymbosa TaxID=529605 RepID=A0AAV1E838_OLDCO|nr:OLC1v1016854C2 [Oldenlandia corymbosa var. corymbosa]